MSTSSNPLLNSFQTPFNAIPFDRIRPEHYLPALQSALQEARTKIESIKANPTQPTFANTVAELEYLNIPLDAIVHAFFALHSAESNDQIREIAKEFSPLLTQFSNDVHLDEALFERVKQVYNQRHQEKLSPEEARLLENRYIQFTLNGALLTPEQKEQFRAIEQQLTSVGLKYSDNVLKASNEYMLELTQESDLAGLPSYVIEAAKAQATKRGKAGSWAITLDMPSYLPFMKYSERSDLRKQLYMAYASRAYKHPQYDNSPLVLEIAKLRLQRAQLLGHRTHAELVLKERMAQTVDTVRTFLNEILDHARPAAERDLAEIKSFRQAHEGNNEINPWDYPYYCEKVKKEKFDIDDNILKPYFEVSATLNGMFTIAHKLYNIRFKLNSNAPKYHKDVDVYEVHDEQRQKFMGLFYVDLYPREGKRSGAWMTSLKSQYVDPATHTEVRPHVSIVCNFTPPSDSAPALLTFGEVRTLFHEFGHALHGLLSECHYIGLSGTNVFWDFVELPSQIMENWIYEQESLALFARHYQTGEQLPQVLIEKIRASAQFQEGYATLRQLSFGLLDFGWHANDPSSVTIETMSRYEQQMISKAQLFPVIENTNQSCSFSHIFSGGYSAGYYSYKWAEVLDADAFEAFQEEGIFNPATAARFRDNILSRGGSDHPMNLYLKFRGKKPSINALLKRSGLK